MWGFLYVWIIPPVIYFNNLAAPAAPEYFVWVQLNSMTAQKEASLLTSLTTMY